MIGVSHFQKLLIRFKYVLSTCMKCIDYRLVRWQNRCNRTNQ